MVVYWDRLQDTGINISRFQGFRGIGMFYLTFVTLHLLGAVVWIGGMLFLGLVLTPILLGHPPKERAAFLHAVGRRFLKIGTTASKSPADGQPED